MADRFELPPEEASNAAERPVRDESEPGQRGRESDPPRSEHHFDKSIQRRDREYEPERSKLVVEKQWIESACAGDQRHHVVSARKRIRVNDLRCGMNRIKGVDRRVA